MNNWQVEPFSNVVIGKRVKRTVVDENENVYYFKEPIQRYPWEFWTEIASSKIGQSLGFNVLDYNIASFYNVCGCISKSMVGAEEELIHGQQLLTQINPKFDKRRGSDHTFQLLEELFLNDQKLKHCFDFVLSMLVYDAVVGNHDRHQQNWALIRKNEFGEKWWYKFVTFFVEKWTSPGKTRFEEIFFSQLFDNGNCLAYNITNQGIIEFTQDENKLLAYAFGPRSTSHIRWKDKAIGHFELLNFVREKYKRKVDKIIKDCLSRYNVETVSGLIDSLDDEFDASQFPANILTFERKQVFKRLIELRIEKLRGLLRNAG